MGRGTSQLVLIPGTDGRLSLSASTPNSMDAPIDSRRAGSDLSP